MPWSTQHHRPGVAVMPRGWPYTAVASIAGQRRKAQLDLLNFDRQGSRPILIQVAALPQEAGRADALFSS
jgi:hypothetical protein